MRTNGIACPCIGVVRFNSRCPLYGASINRGSSVYKIYNCKREQACVLDISLVSHCFNRVSWMFVVVFGVYSVLHYE